MPGGIPVATLAIGVAGAKNAGLLAVRILGTSDSELTQKMLDFMKAQTDSVMENNLLPSL
jgi:5-(carboxyamino)imidazole ribonucleotide mutase